MKNQLQLRLEVKAALQQWVANIMQQNQIPAYMMEDALVSVQLSLKDLVMQDTLMEIRMEQASMEQNPMEQAFMQPREEVEQNDGGTEKESNN